MCGGRRRGKEGAGRGGGKEIRKPMEERRAESSACHVVFILKHQHLNRGGRPAQQQRQATSVSVPVAHEARPRRLRGLDWTLGRAKRPLTHLLGSSSWPTTQANPARISGQPPLHPAIEANQTPAIVRAPGSAEANRLRDAEAARHWATDGTRFSPHLVSLFAMSTPTATYHSVGNPQELVLVSIICT
jgi:hypothetical protein